MKTYQITETTVYTVEAESAERAEEKFLNAIQLAEGSGITCEVLDRDVDPE